MIETFKILNNIEKIDYEQFFTLRRRAEGEQRVTKGHRQKIFKERTNTVLCREFVKNRVIDTWNRLPERVVESRTVDMFKGRYDEYMSVNREEL